MLHVRGEAQVSHFGVSISVLRVDEDDAADTSAASTTAGRGEPLVIRSTLIVAAEEGSEPIALVAAA